MYANKKKINVKNQGEACLFIAINGCELTYSEQTHLFITYMIFFGKKIYVRKEHVLSKYFCEIN